MTDGQKAQQVNRVLGEDDRPDVLEWVAEAANSSSKQVSFNINGMSQTIQYIDPFQFGEKLRRLALQHREDHAERRAQVPG
jgi:hypothetical protein